jgi:hypothetical protein
LLQLPERLGVCKLAQATRPPAADSLELWRRGKMEQVDITNLIVVAMAVAACIPALVPRLPVPGVVLEIVIGGQKHSRADSVLPPVAAWGDRPTVGT